MKIENLKVGQYLYTTSRECMGRTTMRTTRVHTHVVVEVNTAEPWVKLRHMGRIHTYWKTLPARFRVNKPILITSPIMGRSRLATRAEIKAMKAKENPKQ